MAIARLRIANISTANATKLQRILITQSYRFPELVSAAFEQGAGPTIDFLCALFAHHAGEGEISVPDPAWAAGAFLSLAVGGPARLIISGNEPDAADIETKIERAVALFLNGIRAR
jgi:hypothetical protein